MPIIYFIRAKCANPQWKWLWPSALRVCAFAYKYMIGVDTYSMAEGLFYSLPSKVLI